MSLVTFLKIKFSGLKKLVKNTSFFVIFRKCPKNLQRFGVFFQNGRLTRTPLHFFFFVKKAVFSPERGAFSEFLLENQLDVRKIGKMACFEPKPLGSGVFLQKGGGVVSHCFNYYIYYKRLT